MVHLKKFYINPIYIKLDGKPIILTIQTPVVSRNLYGQEVVKYKKTELRLTKLSDIKAGDVLTLRWMYQTQTFAFYGCNRKYYTTKYSNF